MAHSDVQERVHVKLLFFAKSRELVGRSSGELLSPNITSYQELKDSLLTEYPQLAVIGENIVLALNEEYIDTSKHCSNYQYVSGNADMTLN